MIEILRFIFSSFWIWLGMLAILFALAIEIEFLIKASLKVLHLFSRHRRLRNKKEKNNV
jgi:hypothetical protein